MSNILYYSRYCPKCRDFLISLKKNNLLNLFGYKVCVDTQKIPNFVKNVPTIIIKDYDQPIDGEKVFNWIRYKKKQIISQNIKEQEPKQSKNLLDENIGKNYDTLDKAYSEPDIVSNLKRDGQSSINYDNFTITPKIKTKTNNIDYDQYKIKDNIGKVQNVSGGNVDSKLEELQKLRQMDDTLNKT
jgi:hypothetical protein